MRLQEVAHSNVAMKERGNGNHLPRRLSRSSVAQANKHGIWRIGEEEDLSLRMQRRELDGMDYDDNVFGDLATAVDDDDNNLDMELEDRESGGSSADEDSSGAEE